MDIYLKKKGKAKTVVAEVTFPPNFAIFDIYGCNFLVPFFKTTVFDCVQTLAREPNAAVSSIFLGLQASY